MDQKFFEFHLNLLKKKYSFYNSLKDYHLFILLCLKYYFFNDPNIPFDPEFAIEYITDGTRDGGIDAIFNDPNSENNDVIVIQSKYYNKSNVTAEDIVGEVYKINETLKKLQTNKISEYNEKLVTAYKNATSQMEDDGVFRIYFFTSYYPKDKRERNKLDKSIQKYFNEFDIEINFGADIEMQIELCDSGKLYIDSDKLILDKKDNYLQYEESIIVNISALSLQELQNRRRNSLYGMNLRFFIKQKIVDEGIEKTIKDEPENFWYKNNGITIVCDDFKIDGREIKLYNFSLVNGGQTTNKIGRMDIGNDFYIQCKIVKLRGNTIYERDTFVNNIAKATNAQKPIKKSDLKSNTPEQLRLKERLRRKDIYYITKKGEKPPKHYSEPYQISTLEQLGKLSLATVLQMPGSARSHSQKMYDDENYYSIFGPDAKEGVISDVLKISYYYDLYLKSGIKKRGFDENTILPMIKNGKTFQLACITFLCKINYKVFSYNDISRLFNNTDDLKSKLKNMTGIDSLITKRFDDEQTMFYKMFDIIGEEVLGYCYETAAYRANNDNETLAPSDYLKSDVNYYKDILKRLWSRYVQNKELQKNIDSICGISTHSAI